MPESKSKISGSSGSASLLTELIESEAYIGEVYSLDYGEALVRVQDTDRRKVGGIPALSLLAATRINPKTNIDSNEEDASIILLRVIDRGELPADDEFTRLKIMSVNKIAGNSEKMWDDQDVIDPVFQSVLSYTGIRCRILGTFYVSEVSGDKVLTFGSDLNNYYPNSALKVFKLRGPHLEKVVNFRRPDIAKKASNPVPIGEIRYASTNRAVHKESTVPISITPTDLINQRTALFGMTRTGKSNTTKIILKSIFQLRFDSKTKIGQLVFDPNGEYANENVQDKDVIRNMWMSAPNNSRNSIRKEIITYGILPRDNDPHRKLMHLNFYSEENLQIGKDIIDNALSADPTKYISNFRDVRFEPIDDNSPTAEIAKHKRKVLCYRTLLFKAGFVIPGDLEPDVSIFDEKFLTAMATSESKRSALYKRSSEILNGGSITWNQLSSLFKDIYDFINDRDSGFREFDNEYTKENPNQISWAEEDFMKIIEMFRYTNGPKMIGRVKNQHGTQKLGDYADEVYSELKNGNLVIIDQSSGDTELNNITANRIMQRIFDGNQSCFISGTSPKEILIYIEEAHNLLPAAESRELSNIWVRTAKEGAKYHIGLIYATQEVSSIQKNVLRNTANWFIGHLNNTDETRELNKFYDFSDFEMSILRADEKGFLRMKTLSNPYIIPVQIQKFTI